VSDPQSLGTNPEHLRECQYRDPRNLGARMALHARYTKAPQPWHRWLIGRITWPEGARVLEVGCGTGALWERAAPALPPLRLTLTDLSPGMLETAVTAVGALGGIELVEARTADVMALPFDDGAFDVVVANHMLYHLPDLDRGVAELARVLDASGVLLAATNGAHHLDGVAEISRQVLGWSTSDFVAQRFGKENGGAVLRRAFGSVEWHEHPSTMVISDPDDVEAYITSSSAFQDAAPETLAALRRAIDERFAQGGGSLEVRTESGCFVARSPASLR
jgi:SAM-dependent methyltransferase